MGEQTSEQVEIEDTRDSTCIVCPYCGHRHTDAYEFFSDASSEETEVECHECERTFYAFRNIYVTYIGRAK